MLHYGRSTTEVETPRKTLLVWVMLILCALVALPARAQFVPPEPIGAGADPSLPSGYETEAWLVYTYEIDTTGAVVNPEIHSSNGVLQAEQSILNQVSAQQFRPAMRNGNPVKVFVGPVFYTWIVDKPRELSPDFDAMYQQAWERFNAEDYDGAFDLAAQLKAIPGRSGYEEVKWQILAASISSRWDDTAAELSHLERAVELQTLADGNRFKNPYIERNQYLLMLERIHSLQLERSMLADAAATLDKMIAIGAGSEVTTRAKEQHLASDRQFRSMPDVAIAGELTPIYRGGPGAWETRLSRGVLRLDGVRGKVDGVMLSCAQGDQSLRFPATEPWRVPVGWNQCKVEVSGRSGTRFQLHQLASG
ncbi:energy transducer TonB [Halioglobus pacificus]|uniref:TonB C-terminal domain-containing protein n=1 Tax=Parahalioglobus pacificus TaxID=930806 RepID=A0A918XI20_9GAMM|nr:energy transducer TonB [Halioglobus pacificus]GHD31669.1 hypothetical protein GCM10007053_14980 [Halioglobus pacificus]